MILTYKIKHSRDFTSELAKATQVAWFAIDTRSRTTKDVRQFGLKAVIANQVLRKYGRNKQAENIKKVKLTVPSQGIRYNIRERTITVSCLELKLNYCFRNDFTKINQIEIDKDFAYVSVTVPEKAPTEPLGYIGVDRNATQHIAVVGNTLNGKVIKLGKSAEHIHKKYKNIRRQLQKEAKYRKVKEIKSREKRIERDLNHKVSKKIVDTARKNGMGIKLEYLRGIRNAKSGRDFRYSLHSWSFYQLEQMIEYKARLLGVPVAYVDPHHTSKNCSVCGLVGNRSGKKFKCPTCGHVDHADANASFNIALRPELNSIDRLHADRDVCKGNTDIPKEATL